MLVLKIKTKWYPYFLRYCSCNIQQYKHTIAVVQTTITGLKSVKTTAWLNPKIRCNLKKKKSNFFDWFRLWHKDTGTRPGLVRGAAHTALEHLMCCLSGEESSGMKKNEEPSVYMFQTRLYNERKRKRQNLREKEANRVIQTQKAIRLGLHYSRTNSYKLLLCYDSIIKSNLNLKLKCINIYFVVCE